MLEDWLKDVERLDHVGNVRNAGFIAGVELAQDKKTKRSYDRADKMGWRVALYARDNVVFIRPLGNVIVIMPPLSISEQNLIKLLEVIKSAIIKATGTA